MKVSETMSVLSTVYQQSEPRDMYTEYNFDTTNVNDGVIFYLYLYNIKDKPKYLIEYFIK